MLSWKLFIFHIYILLCSSDYIFTLLVQGTLVKFIIYAIHLLVSEPSTYFYALL
nr:MAG TPA: hypothetical protein [Crassvirales sp.]